MDTDPLFLLLSLFVFVCFRDSWSAPPRPNFWCPWATIVGFTPWLLYRSACQSTEGIIHLKMLCIKALDFSYRTRSCISILTSAADLYLPFLSDSHAADELTYSWKPENPVQVNGMLTDGGRFLEGKLALGSVTADSCDVETATNRYSCVNLTLKLTKK